MARKKKITSFRLRPGDLIANKYEVEERLGSGMESEVYLVRERRTGIERAAKLFFPERNRGNRAVRFHARKLHRLRECPIIIQYHTQEHVVHQGTEITLLISEFVDGERLSD
ncbi:MAG: serine/threonine protein kinase, partial [Thermoanaerobaculia bacterium]|nr:serine/threonine protein kinase [Thermoanaerobaculia bacterium]